MTGLIKNLRFWMVNLHQQVGVFVFCWSICRFMIQFSEGGNWLEEMVMGIPVWLTVAVCIFFIIYATSSVKFFLPLTISFGSRRKDSILAMVSALHMLFAEYLLVMAGWIYFVGDLDLIKRVSPFVLSALGMMLLLLGFGFFLTLVVICLGSKGVIVYCIVCGLVGAGTGVLLSSVFTRRTGTTNLFLGYHDPIEFVRQPWIFLLGIGIDVLAIVLLYSQIKKKDLQFG